MDLQSFIIDNAIASIEDLHLLENSQIWMVIAETFDGSDYYAAKVPWLHGGIVDHRGRNFNNDFDQNKMYFCSNKEIPNEYFSIQDFLFDANNSTDLNCLFTSEEMADSLVNVIILTRSQTNREIQKALEDNLRDRSFALRGTDEFSLFDMLSVVNDDMIKIIPMKK